MMDDSLTGSMECVDAALYWMPRLNGGAGLTAKAEEMQGNV